MSITFGEAKATLSQYAGRAGFCTEDKSVELFVKKTLQYLLFSGQYGNLRKFCFCAIKGCFTIPYELETILKVNIDGELASSWSKWSEWHQERQLIGNCIVPGNELYEDPNYYATIYDVPPGGRRIGIVGTAEEDSSAHIIIMGKDPTGREIITNHNGKQISGELLRIVKGELRYTQVTFGVITGVLKSHTNGYTQLLWVNPETNNHGYLADYSPLEEKPSYRKYRITSRNCGNIVKVSVLGRIRLREKYTDTDFIPFENLYTLEMAGQQVQLQYNNDIQSAVIKDQFIQQQIENENSYKRVENGQPCEFFHPLSGGSIVNITWGSLK